MTFRCAISSLTFVGALKEDIPIDGITVLVGPNNVGKTLTLRSIATFLTNPPARLLFQPTILANLKLQKDGDEPELTSWMETHGRPIKANPADGRIYYGNDNQIAKDQALTVWREAGYYLGPLYPVMIGQQFADNRLNLINQTQLHDIRTQLPQHPLQQIFMDTTLENKLSELVFRAFGEVICINRYVEQIELRVGKPDLSPVPPPPPRELLDEYMALPLVNNQGDGVKSFIGLLLHTVIPGQPVQLIDEPEAFLHPPQARLIGRILARETPSNGQLIIATHSQDFLQGLLESPTRPIKIVRLSRDAAKNLHVLSLEPSHVRSLWSDAQIRYSNLLDGMFHSGVVIGESDADCQFYSASIDVIDSNGRDRDLLFTHVGGKARIPKALRELRKFGVRCCAIADLDLLNDTTLVKATVESAGGDWSDFITPMNVVNDAVRSLGSSQPILGRVLDDINDFFKADRTRPLTKDDSNKIASIVKVASGWEQLKRGGISAVPQGQGSMAINTVWRKLASLGVFLVPVGELERWIPEISGKSSSWVSSVLESNQHEHPNDQLKTFCSEIADYMG